jgi:predicted short-subunit dehydrogenase-like oxidoreductase (DUF2520 family)
MKFSKKDKLIIIGSGKISHSLVPALLEANYQIDAIINRNRDKAEIFASKFNIKKYSDKFDGLNIKRGIFILAVPDNQIRKTAELLSTFNLDFINSLFIHLSGSQNISLLKSIQNQGGFTASLHLMQTFPSQKRKDLKNFFSAIETTSDDVSDFLFKLSRNLKLFPYRLTSKNKSAYHLAGVYASNFINALMFESQQLFDSLNVKEYTFKDIFIPIVLSTIKNIGNSSPADALSGPVERGDLDTIKMHIKEIRRISRDNTELLQSYVSLSLILIEACVVKFGNLSSQQSEIQALLIKELNNPEY